MSADRQVRRTRCGGLVFHFRADPMVVRGVVDEAMTSMAGGFLSEAGCRTAEIVIVEVLNNIVEHAYAGAAGWITLVFHSAENGVRCCITDSGVPLRPDLLRDRPLPDASDTDLPEGGFGWHLIHSLSQSVAYRRRGGRNRLTLVLAPPG